MNTDPKKTILLIETIRVAPGGDIPLLDGHQRRLENSCLELGYPIPGDALWRGVLKRAGSLDARGAHRLRLLLDVKGQYTLCSDPLPATPQPVRLRLEAASRQAENQWLLHKTTHRPWYAAAQSWLAGNPDFFDVIYCNSDDEVCEGSRSNIYILDAAGVWLTPPVRCGLLPGVQRQALLDAGRVQEARFSRNELMNARGVRVSNALRGWLDAVLQA